jgi:hypothetical protein
LKKSGDMERGEMIRQLESVIQQGIEVMEDARLNKKTARLQSAMEGWRQAQGMWLQVARGMSPEKAQAVMVGFAVGELTKWMEERRPGPPPSVLTLYDGPISDEEYGKAIEGR